MYSTDDAFQDGEADREYGYGKNDYDKIAEPKCYAAWEAGFNGKPNPHPGQLEGDE